METAGPKPRFVIDCLKARDYGAKALYENFTSVRGEKENRIKGEKRPWRQ